MQLMSLYDCTLSLHVLTHAVLQPMQLMSQYLLYVLTLAVLQPMRLMSVYSVCVVLLTLAVLQPMQLMSLYSVNPCSAAAHAVDVTVRCMC